MLIVEGLGLLIANAGRNGKIKGIVFSLALAFTHLLFVDDVVLFGKGSLEEWRCFRSIIDTFTTASSMLISIDKSYFFTNNVNNNMSDDIKVLFPYKLEPIEVDFKYMAIG